MFKNAFQKLELDDVAIILDAVNDHIDGGAFDPVDTTIMAIDVPFYPGYRFLEISDTSLTPARKRFVIIKSEQANIISDVVVLDWTNEPIYILNQKAPIQLNADNIAEYVRFFFTYVRGKHGRFIVTENVDDINWKEDPPPQARKAIAKMLVPVELKEEKDGNMYLEATMMFRDSLFKADVEVQPNGLVSLSNEKLLVEDMPVRDDTFGQ
ncbi:MAG: hypothetical protein CMH27_07105 [Micavibrio sp.]|nr:hypothetical protein [Micavibrio sp.]|tara:strand:- start:2020 stop:2649 length:630 start_codon:yes stop_codon:yes gene_type:complete